MAFSFIHAADLHLGSHLVGITAREPKLAERLAAASRDAFAALVDQAITRQVAFAIVAGDVYHGEWRDPSIGPFFNRQVSRLVRAGIPRTPDRRVCGHDWINCSQVFQLGGPAVKT